jgi:vancomycin permeability regulator SanA
MLMVAMTSMLHTSREAYHGTTVVIVLGEMLLPPSGTPSKNLQARMKAARKVVTMNMNVEHEIFSGGDTARLQKTEAAVMNEMWHESSVDFTHHFTLHMEERSLSTCQNAFYSIPIL